MFFLSYYVVYMIIRLQRANSPCLHTRPRPKFGPSVNRCSEWNQLLFELALSIHVLNPSSHCFILTTAARAGRREYRLPEGIAHYEHLTRRVVTITGSNASSLPPTCGWMRARRVGGRRRRQLAARGQEQQRGGSFWRAKKPEVAV